MRDKPKPSSFVEQAAILAAASLFVRFIGFLYRLPLTTLIGDEGNAYYAAGYNIYTFALILSSMGLPAAISKLVSERIALKQFKNAHEVFRVAMKIAMIGGAACSIFLALGAGWLARVTGYPEAVYAIRTLSPTIFIVAVMAVYRGYFQGMNTTVPTAVSQAVEQVFNAVFSIWLAYLFFDAAKIEFSAAGGTAGTGVGAVAGLLVIVGIYALLSKDIKARIDGEQRRMFHSRSFSSYDVKRPNERNRFDENQRVLAKEIIKIAFPIIIGTAIFSIANFIDMTMAQSRLEASGAFDYGEIKVLYGQFTGKYVLLTTLPVSLSTALAVAAVPSIAGSKMVSDHAAVKGKINMALRLSMIVSIPAAVGLGVLSDPILKLLIPRHPEGGILLRYGVAAIIMLALVQTVTGILQGIGKVNVPVVGALLGTLLKVPLNYFLIANPKINIIGAVLSSCAMYLVAALVGIYFLNKYTGITPDIKGAFLKPLASAAAMGLMCYVVYYTLFIVTSNNAFSVLAAIVLGFVVYVIFMALFRGFKKTDLEQFRLSKKLVKLLGV